MGVWLLCEQKRIPKKTGYHLNLTSLKKKKNQRWGVEMGRSKGAQKKRNKVVQRTNTNSLFNAVPSSLAHLGELLEHATKNRVAALDRRLWSTVWRRQFHTNPWPVNVCECVLQYLHEGANSVPPKSKLDVDALD